MSSTPAIALSGMNAAQSSLSASANNIASLDTAGVRRQRVDRSEVPGGGVAASLVQASASGDPEVADVVGLLQARNQFLANLSVFRASERMTGTLLDHAA